MERRTNTGERRRRDVLVAAAATQIVRAAVEPDCSAADLADLAASDPGFGMRLLAMVNSPAFGLSHRVSDVRRAASLLGVRGLRNLALSLVVSDMAPTGDGGRLLLSNSMRRAVAARSLAAALGERELDTFFTAGLLLESGLLVLGAEDLERATAIAASPAPHRLLRERASGAESHPEVGASLAERFGLPESTVEAIRRHHDPDPPDDLVPRVAWLAERLAAVFEGGDPAGARDAAIRDAGRIGISPRDAMAALDVIPELVREGARALDRDLGDQVDVGALLQDAHRSLVEMNEHYEELVRTLEGVIAEKEALAARLEQANRELAQLAATDALTGLPNKRALTEALERDLARAERAGTPVSLVVVDVDHFKRFNDRWGHAIGDEVLRAVGGVLRASVRTGDLAARYGGEEFVLVLPGARESDACAVAERVRRRLAAHEVAGPEGALRVTASFGVATVSGPGCARAAEPLFARADAALYAAKRAGRNRVTGASELDVEAAAG
ncbi:MAG TPA: diguanylate cyclase [Sandaracinaceae bacterium LLY-WYZ-13_1]|nr:diguanylate cyclase [Sandaracinaceae bacterium LLY-WYZ-13_1]